MATTKIFYHANCNDGFAAAWVAWRRYGSDAQYLPCQYNDTPPLVSPGDKVIIVDFSFSRDILLGWRSQGTEVLVLDHHKTAAEQLLGLKFALFDQSKCGAVLTWEYFFPDVPIPLMLKYVQDRDLWHKVLLHTEEVYVAMRSLPQEFEQWEKLYERSDEEFLQQMVEIGTPILERRREEIEQMVSLASVENLAGYKVPIAQASAYWSDVAHKLLEQYPQYPFAVCWRDDERQANFKYVVRHWELRSRKNENFDVSIVAQSNGGGGHKHAAGFQTIVREE